MKTVIILSNTLFAITAPGAGGHVGTQAVEPQSRSGSSEAIKAKPNCFIAVGIFQPESFNCHY
jgi:hypothetical protein